MWQRVCVVVGGAAAYGGGSVCSDYLAASATCSAVSPFTFRVPSLQWCLIKCSRARPRLQYTGRRLQQWLLRGGIRST